MESKYNHHGEGLRTLDDNTIGATITYNRHTYNRPPPLPSVERGKRNLWNEFYTSILQNK